MDLDPITAPKKLRALFTQVSRSRGAFPPLASRGGVYLFTETAWLRHRILLEYEAFAKLSEFFVIKSRCVVVDFL